MTNVKCPLCKRSYQLSYDPNAVIGREVRCKACGCQFVVERDAPSPPARPNVSPMRISHYNGKTFLLVGIPAVLVLVTCIVVAVVLGQRSTGSGGMPGQASDNRVDQIVVHNERNLPLLPEPLKKVEDERVREEKIREARVEQARIVFERQREIAAEAKRQKEAQRQREEDQQRQKLLLATVPGTVYIGTISQNGDTQRIHMAFTEQKGFLIRSEISNPDKPIRRQTFVGELGSIPKVEENGETFYLFQMSAVGAGPDYENNDNKTWWSWQKDRSFAFFYCAPTTSLKLHLVDTGLEGGGQAGYFPKFIISLRRGEHRR